jgi:hypothetical protein
MQICVKQLQLGWIIRQPILPINKCQTHFLNDNFSRGSERRNWEELEIIDNIIEQLAPQLVQKYFSAKAFCH